MVSVSVEESAINAIRIKHPPLRRLSVEPAPTPVVTERHLGGDDLYRLFCGLREKSRGDDPNAAWIEFQQFVTAEKVKVVPTPSHSPS